MIYPLYCKHIGYNQLLLIAKEQNPILVVE